MAKNRPHIERRSLGALASIACLLASTGVRGQVAMVMEASVFGAGGGTRSGGDLSLDDTLGQVAPYSRGAVGSEVAEGFWNLLPAVTGNRPPTPRTDVVHRNPGGPAKISVTGLSNNDSDPDGDAFTLISVDSSSALGGSIQRIGPWIYYLPPAGPDVADSFQYTLADSSGLTAQATVNILVGFDTPPPAQNILGVEVLSSGHRRIKFAAVPGLTYHVDASSDLSTWIRLGSVAADALGEFEWEDVDAASFPTRFYRSTWP